MDFDTHLRLILFVGIFNGIGMYFAILEGDSAGNLLAVVFGELFIEEHMVDLFLQELGMCQLTGQVSVVGKKQNARGIAVEPAYRIDAFRAHTLHNVHHRLALLRVVAGRYIIFRFVDEYVYLLFQRDRLFVEDDFIAAKHLRSQLGHDVSVHLHHTGLYELVGLPTTAYTSIGQELRFFKLYLALGL